MVTSKIRIESFVELKAGNFEISWKLISLLSVPILRLRPVLRELAQHFLEASFWQIRARLWPATARLNSWLSERERLWHHRACHPPWDARSRQEVVAMIRASRQEAVAMIRASRQVAVVMIRGSRQEAVAMIRGSRQEAVAMIWASRQEAVAIRASRQVAVVIRASRQEAVAMIRTSRQEAVAMIWTSRQEAVTIRASRQEAVAVRASRQVAVAMSLPVTTKGYGEWTTN